MEGLRSPIRMLLDGLEGSVLLVLAVATWPLTRRWLSDLGARPEEREREWPGDRLLTRIDRRATRAITVRAPVAAVWPWLVQFGLGRGGFHSYELLERLAGIDVRNVERILPRLQSLEIDQEIKLHPSAPGLYVSLLVPNAHLDTSVFGRVLAEDVKLERKKLASRGNAIDDALGQALVDAGVGEVRVRSATACEAEHGVCRLCYGWSLATGRLVDIGESVGIVAAQSIGEPGTQLTMRTFHTGGVAGEDITHGLPRVVELFEARRPKEPAVINATTAGVSSTRRTSSTR